MEEPSLILQVLISAATEKKETVVQVEQRRLVIKLNLINKFCILKYASREPYIFPRKISNYYDHCCLLCLGNFLLQEYAGALLGGVLPTLLLRAEIEGMVIKLEFIKERRKKKEFQDYQLFKSHIFPVSKDEIALNT